MKKIHYTDEREQGAGAWYRALFEASWMLLFASCMILVATKLIEAGFPQNETYIVAIAISGVVALILFADPFNYQPITHPIFVLSFFGMFALAAWIIDPGYVIIGDQVSGLIGWIEAVIEFAKGLIQ